VGLVTEIVENLRPSGHVASLAKRIVANLTAGGAAYNGLHLRIEDDTDWVDGSGGADVRAQNQCRNNSGYAQKHTS
jgi:uncharacterized NAD-dependent epimerase/dehydratase family protein